MFPQDARIYQIIFLSLFLVLGIGTRDWTLQAGMILATIATCLLTQTILLWATRAEGELPDRASVLKSISHSIPSALITSLGLSLLLRADHYSTIVLASIAAILSKFVLRVNDKHIFNPANFGIIAALLITPDAWVSPGQWGEERWYALLFLSAGGLVLKQVGRWDTTVAFLGTYAGLEAVRNVWLGWTWDVWAHRLTSGSLLLFALFMITDPRTIPNARMGRLIWAVSIALLTFILRNYFFVSTAVLWALVMLAPLSILLDWIWTAPRFSWNASTDITLELNRSL